MTTPAPEPASQPAALPYAVAPVGRWRHRLRMLATACAILIVALVLLRWGFVPLRQKAVFLTHQSRCMNFMAAPGTVAHTEDAATIARLTGGARSGPGWATLMSNGATVAYYLAPEPLRRVEQTPGVDIPQGFGPVFLHGRSAPGGGQRLVVVKVEGFRAYRAPGMNGPPIPDYVLDVSVMVPARLRGVPAVMRTRWNPPTGVPAFGSLTLFAGQPDPVDTSHFTIDYLTPAGRGTVDGWLQPDDTVKFAVRAGPLAQQQPAAAP